MSLRDREDGCRIYFPKTIRRRSKRSLSVVAISFNARLFRFSPRDHALVEPLVLWDHDLGVEPFDRPRAATRAHPPPVFARQNLDGAVGHRPSVSDPDQVTRFAVEHDL